MPYDCGTVSFGVSTVYDSGDFPALFDELLRRLDYPGARREQADVNARPSGAAGHRPGHLRGEDRAGPVRDRARRGAARRALHRGHRRLVDGPGTGDRAGADPRRGARAPRRPLRRATRRHRRRSRAAWAPTARAARSPPATRPTSRRASWSPRRGRGRRAVGRRRTRSRATRAASWRRRGQRVTLAELARRAAGRRRVVQRAQGDLRGLRRRGRGRGRRRHGAGARCAGSWWAPTSGRAVNPGLVDGQLVGGVAFGIGNTLHETLEYDADGQLLTGTLMDYALAARGRRARGRRLLPGGGGHTNPLGLRGLGECGNPGLGGAIANAVCDAFRGLGVAITALPLTPARVREAIRTAGL